MGNAIEKISNVSKQMLHVGARDHVRPPPPCSPRVYTKSYHVLASAKVELARLVSCACIPLADVTFRISDGFPQNSISSSSIPAELREVVRNLPDPPSFDFSDGAWWRGWARD